MKNVAPKVSILNKWLIILCLSLTTQTLAQAPLSVEAQNNLNLGRQAAIQALVTYSQHIVDQSLWQDAIFYGQQALAEAPNNLEVLRFLAETYSTTGWHIRAWQMWNRYLDNGGTLDEAAREQVVKAGLEMGYTTHMANNLEASLNYHLAVFELDPRNKDAAAHAGRILLELRAPEQAAIYWNIAVSLDPNDSGARFFLDLALRQQRWGVGAVTSFDEGIRLYTAGNRPAAQQRFSDATRQNPNYAEAWAWLGRSHFEQGNYASAAQSYQRAFASDTTNPTYAYFYNESLRLSGQDFTAVPIPVAPVPTPVTPAIPTTPAIASSPATPSATQPAVVSVAASGSSVCTRPDEEIRIPDPNLEAALRTELRRRFVAITCESMKDITDLRLSDINNLEGLQHARNLDELRLEGSQLLDVTPLASLDKLVSLRLKENQISDLSALAGLRNLTLLDLEDNRVSDLTPLSNLSNLETLILNDNFVNNLAPLSNLRRLDNLFLDSNRVSDLSPLASLNLEQLELSNNVVLNLNTLPRLSGLTVLKLDSNNHSDLRPLAGLSSLGTLSFDKNNISDLSPLVGLNNLRELRLNGNRVQNLAPLSNLRNLNLLQANDNLINDLSSLSGLSQLQELSLENNNINNLTSLSSMGQLSNLFLSNNQISDLRPLSNFNRLGSLALTDNLVSDLRPLANLSNLSVLKLGGNNISDLRPLATLSQIYDLELDNNQITDIRSLASLSRLSSLALSHNNIGDLSAVAGLYGLANLQLADNVVKDITVLSNLTRLQTLDLTGNEVVNADALLSNSYLARGSRDRIQLRNNCIPESSFAALEELASRGGRVDYTPQASCSEQ